MTQKISFEIDDETESAAETVLAAIEEQHGQTQEIDEKAERVFREFVANQYSQLPPQKQEIALAEIVSNGQK